MKLIILMCRVSGVFAALSIHVMSIRRLGDTMSKKLADHRAQLCMLGLGEMQEPWPCGGWILQVFVRIMDKVKSRGITKGAFLGSQIRDGSGANLSNINVENSIDIQGETGQGVPRIVDPNLPSNIPVEGNIVGLGNPMDSSQFSTYDGSFSFDILNENDYLFPEELSQDFASQIPYFREFSMLGV